MTETATSPSEAAVYVNNAFNLAAVAVVTYDGSVAINYPGNSQSVVAATWSSNVATITLGSAPPFPVGQTVMVSGMFPVAYNGTFVVTGVSGTTFTYALSEASNPGAGISGTVTPKNLLSFSNTVLSASGGAVVAFTNSDENDGSNDNVQVKGTIHASAISSASGQILAYDSSAED